MTVNVPEGYPKWNTMTAGIAPRSADRATELHCSRIHSVSSGVRFNGTHTIIEKFEVPLIDGHRHRISVRLD
jgi:hypothetical protein